MERSLPIIVRLPEELRHSVLSYCGSSAILNLCLTSKVVHATCIRLLFHTIDLSYHNSDIWGTHTSDPRLKVPPDHRELALTQREKCVTETQRKLLKQLSARLDLGLQTRVLRWTLADTDPALAGEDIRNTSLVAFNHGTFDLWGVFTCFGRISEIDIAFMTGYRELDPPPTSLFSTATSVSLGGIASYRVIATILNSADPAKLRHLRFNNLQTFAEPAWFLHRLSDDKIKSHRRNRRGVAQGFLAELTGRCSSLRSFHLHTTAEFVAGSTAHISRPSNHWLTQVTDDHTWYAEIGAFIASVKPSLHELVFEHGPDINYSPNYYGARFHPFAGPNHDAPLPMDVYFGTHILPVLTSGPWPKLRSMAVKGIGHWKPIRPWRDDARPEEIRWLHAKTREFRDKAVMLWDAVGGECKVVVEDEASRPFYRFQADTYASHEGNL